MFKSRVISYIFVFTLSIQLLGLLIVPGRVLAARTDCIYQRRQITQSDLDLIENAYPGSREEAVRFYTNLKESGVDWLFISCPEAPEENRLYILSLTYEDGDDVMRFINLSDDVGAFNVQTDSLDETDDGFLSIEDTNEAQDFIDAVHDNPDSIDDTAGILDGTDEPVDREPPADEGEGDEEDETPKCEEDLDWTDYQWVPCLFLTTVDIFVNEAIEAVNSMLAVEPEEVNDDGLKQAWSYFRNIASLLLVVIGLAMIIGQGISKE